MIAMDQDVVAVELSAEHVTSTSDQDLVASELGCDSFVSTLDSSADLVADGAAASTAIVIACPKSKQRATDIVPLSVTKNIQRQKRTIRHLRLELVAAQKQVSALQACRSEKHKRCAPHVGLRLALARNEGNSGLAAYGRMLDGKRSANCIKAWELAAGNSLLAGMCHFHAAMEKPLLTALV